ncbi:hypothetical protein GBAR_LOCUS1189 [Geodia barretti]|uniref:Uncharacterized protein n=1 Tax=Geodia barretti TaxID=519541 RepID=A0AA35W4I7_GEOBA|nr:hypothetical protein GBAR_LOCUS1189 [Geodia barretti]
MVLEGYKPLCGDTRFYSYTRRNEKNLARSDSCGRSRAKLPCKKLLQVQWHQYHLQMKGAPVQHSLGTLVGSDQQPWHAISLHHLPCCSKCARAG